MKLRWISVLSLAVLMAAPNTLQSDEAASLKQALSEADVGLSLHYRLETVDDDAFAKDATASTLRTVLSYKSKEFRGWTLDLAAENVAVIGSDDYRNAGAGSLSNGVTDRPVIADPAITAVHTAALSYAKDSFRGTLGRKEINYADQRFVGAVGWRQHHQTFDTLELGYQVNDNVDLTYAFLGKVHRIVGASVDLDGHLAGAKFGLGDAGTLRAYLLNLDYEDLIGLSTTTLGAEFAGAQPWGEGRKWLYEIEYATQSDAGDNPGDIDANYLHVMGGAQFSPVTLKVGMETLSGGADGVFRTPLATLHKFNGWADKFLATPGNGLEDFYVSLGGKHGKWSWAAIYHDFSPEAGGGDHGSEVDGSLSYKTDWGQTFALKTASYSADNHSTDATKWWLWTQVSF